MGSWTLESLNAHSKERNGDVFGHDFHVFYRLRYTTSAFGSFVEPPLLDWHEKCMYLDHGAGEWWEFDLNLYEIKPQSKTLLPWSRRYLEAYRNAAGTTNRTELEFGSVKLLDSNGQAVPIDKLGRNKNTKAEQADAVRHYLKRHGGILVIEIHDNPGCRLPAPATQHAERLLVFNVGVVGGGLRQQAEQWWLVNGATPAQPDPTWQRSFTLTWARNFSSRGFRKVQPAANLVTPLPAAFGDGEYR